MVVKEQVGSVCPLIRPLTDAALPEIARRHTQRYGFRMGPWSGHHGWLYYEGTFDPFSNHHLVLIHMALSLGFRRGVIGIVFQNPYKARTPTPYEHRREMARIMLESSGISCLTSYEEWCDVERSGLYIPSTKLEFDHLRENALRDERAHILIGADNFQRAMQGNVLWSHVTERLINPRREELYGFRSLYELDESFGRRVLVPPVLFDAHATHVRAGAEPLPEILGEYAAAHNLQHFWRALPTEDGLVRTEPPKCREKSPSWLLAVDSVMTQLRVGLGDIGLLNPRIESKLDAIGADLDPGHLASLQRLLRSQSGIAKRSSLNSSEVVRPFRRAIVQALLDSEQVDFTSSGGEHLLQAIGQEQQILLVGNQSGWADILLFAMALRNEGLGVLSEDVRIVGPHLQFPNQIAALLFGRSVAWAGYKNLQLYSAFEEDLLLLFPEKHPSEKSMGYFSAEPLRPLLNKHQDLSTIAVIPWAQCGGGVLSAGGTPESVYLKVSFGAPLALEELQLVLAQGLDVARHYLGFAVAEQLPHEYRGPYIRRTDACGGNGESTSPDVCDPDGADLSLAIALWEAIRGDKP